MTEQDIFVEAVQLTDPAARAAYLDRACGSDPALRQRVAGLMGALDRAGDFLREPAAAGCDPEATRGFESADAPAEASGTRIGPFKLLEPLGEGGMGVVYVAEQQHPVRRKVALKVIKPGMDSKQVLARFEAERQALALMDHPHIAKVLDAGATETGRPYFVMELVRGLPATDYCDRAKLSVPGRLALFADICRAVQHAHMKGVIHRDLKPSNVLVTVVDGRLVPKVIDFGIAKATAGALTDRTLHTGHFQLVGTPLYMAPEQAELSGVDVDTRADVYSLGVLLYELLTGTTPFDPETLRKAGFDEMRRIIREDEPARPSHRVSTLAAGPASTAADHRGVDPRRLGRLVRGELDWVVMRALDKDRTRRYQSPAELAADVDRYLTGAAVQAVPPSAAYRLRKFARRNRSRVATAAAVLGLAVLATAVGGWVYLERAGERERATGRVRESLSGARAAAEAGDPVLAGQRVAEARGQLGEGLPAGLSAEVEAAGREVDGRQAAQDRLRRFLALAADAQDKMGYVTYEVSVGGERDAREGLGLYGVLEGDGRAARLADPYLTAAQREQVRATAYEVVVELANFHAYYRRGEAVSRAEAARLILDLLQAAEAFHPPTRALYHVRSEAHLLGGNVAEAEADRARFRATEARTAFDHFLPGRRAQRTGGGAEGARSYRAALRLQPDHYNSLFYLAFELTSVKEYAEAAGLFTGCIALRPGHLFGYFNRAECYRKLGQPAAAEADYDSAVAAARTDDDRISAHIRRHNFYRDAGRVDKAREELARLIALFEKSVEAKKAQLGPDHADTLAALNSLGVAYSEGGRSPDAVRVHEQVLARRKEQLGPGHPDTLLSTNNLAATYSKTGRGELAVRLFETALAASTKQLGPDHAHTLSMMVNLAHAYHEGGQFDRAEPLLADWVERKRRGEGGAKSPDTAAALAMLGMNWLKQQKYAAAEPVLRECLAIRAEKLPDDWRHFNTMSMLGGALLGQGKHAEAEPLVLKGYEGMKEREAQIPLDGKVRLPEAFDRLVGLYEATGQPDKARAWRDKRPPAPAGGP